jgi:hypothetical protein
METIQRNFVRSLKDSGFSPARQYKEVKNFLKKEPEITRVLGLREDHYSFCIDTDSVRKVRNYMHATKTTDYKGRTKFEVWEEAVKIFG